MISVVIPTLDAAAHFPRALAPLVSGAMGGLVKQVIVSDGGSRDETLAIAEAAGCDIVVSERGRAKQLIAGAAVARAPWLLFLHADTSLSAGWADEAQAFVDAWRTTACGGVPFRVRRRGAGRAAGLNSGRACAGGC